ncbi:MAG: hypothetical protein Q4A71_06185 [Actinomycetaceae bacterium]|nr:hypothetical protein [Actinomycetaceae bacterium]
MTARIASLTPKKLLKSWAAWGTLLVVCSLILTYIIWPSNHVSELDPENPHPPGAKALAVVLARHGISIQIAHNESQLKELVEKPGKKTLFFTGNSYYYGNGHSHIIPHLVKQVDRLVYANLDTPALESNGLNLDVVPVGGAVAAKAACPHTVFGKAKKTSPNDWAFSPDTALKIPYIPCLDDGYGLAGAVYRPASSGTPETIVVASGLIFQNSTIAEDDNAAAALSLLSAHPTLIWYVPSSAATITTVDEEKSLWPQWYPQALLLAEVGIVLFLLAKGRRFGRLAKEPLPVVVKATETTKSLGALYEKSGDRKRALGKLQAQTRTELEKLLSLPTGANNLVTIISNYSHLNEQEIHFVLYEETDLLKGATALKKLQQEVTDNVG